MTWKSCKKILCVRPDNMGDLLMSSPAISALKETFGCSITLLTSSMGAKIAPYLPAVDDVIVWNVPWVKGTEMTSVAEFQRIIETLRDRNFDGAVVFTVFSQNPLSTALLLTLAGIPRRLAYCRENPYHLLSHWIPDKEPYTFVRHQVRRDLDLVRAIGARPAEERITVRLPENLEHAIRQKLLAAGVDGEKPWLIMHPGVSEEKRRYPAEHWINAGARIIGELDHQIILTGAPNEKGLTDRIATGIGAGAFSMAGTFTLAEFITLIRFSPLLISVNTSSIHIAAAVQTKVIVLYALTNPQHTPWRSVGRVLPFSVPDNLQSRNEVLMFVKENYMKKAVDVQPDEIVDATRELLIDGNEPLIEEIVTSPPNIAHLGDQQNFILP